MYGKRHLRHAVKISGDIEKNEMIKSIIIVSTSLSAGGVGLNLQPNFQKGGGLTTPQLLDGGKRERRGDFFQGGGGCNFQKKNKLKSETFNDKKSFLCHN